MNEPIFPNQKTQRPGLLGRLPTTLLVPLLTKVLRVLIGKNLPSLARWMSTAAGAALVTAGVLHEGALADGLQLGELGLAIVGAGLLLESRVNNWLRGREVYGLNLSGLSVFVGRGAQSAARFALNAAGSWLATTGILQSAEGAEGASVEAVLLGLLMMVATRLWSWAESWAKGELPEQVALTDGLDAALDSGWSEYRG